MINLWCGCGAEFWRKLIPRAISLKVVVDPFLFHTQVDFPVPATAGDFSAQRVGAFMVRDWTLVAVRAINPPRRDKGDLIGGPLRGHIPVCIDIKIKNTGGSEISSK